jgi:hypothetical protein
MANRSDERKRLKLGDVLEVTLPGKGLAYVQYANNHRDPPVYGPLIRVLPGIFRTRPKSLAEMAAGRESWFTFFPAGPAVSRGYLSIVGNEPIPEHARDWPLFKAYNANFYTGERVWYLCDVKSGTSRKVGALNEKYYDCPMREVIDLKILEDRILNGWTPRDEVFKRSPPIAKPADT